MIRPGCSTSTGGPGDISSCASADAVALEGRQRRREGVVADDGDRKVCQAVDGDCVSGHQRQTPGDCCDVVADGVGSRGGHQPGGALVLQQAQREERRCRRGRPGHACGEGISARCRCLECTDRCNIGGVGQDDLGEEHLLVGVCRQRGVGQRRGLERWRRRWAGRRAGRVGIVTRAGRRWRARAGAAIAPRSCTRR